MSAKKNCCCSTQLEDGQWVEAQPIPFYECSLGFLGRVWYTIRIKFSGLFLVWKLWRCKTKNEQRETLEDFEDKWEAYLDKYMIPVESDKK